jgi:hypothetical protein
MKRAMVTVVFAGIVAVLGACGSSGGGKGTGGSGAGSSSSSFHCCINASAYECPNKAAFDKCAGGDPQSCIDMCDPTDPACIDQCTANIGQNDPSDCKLVNEPVASYCGSGNGSGSGSSSSTGGGDDPCNGASCSSDVDCAGDFVRCNSVNHTCFDTHATCEGNPCASEFDCPQSETCDSTFNTCAAN